MIKRGSGGFLQPEKILNQLGLASNLVAADLGCGHGYFSIPLAKRLTNGKVYAVDVLANALEAVNSQAQLEKLKNIEIIRANVENANGSGLGNGSVDLVVLANILFQTQKKEEVLEEAKRVVKDDGQTVIIDWVDGSLLAPKQGWLISKDEVLGLAKLKGFVFDKDLEVDNGHYGMVFKK